MKQITYIFLKGESSALIKENQLSDEQVYMIKDHYSSALPSASEIALALKPNDYVACIFDSFWWLVLVDSINVEEKDLTYNFMHLHVPTNNIH